IPGVKVYESQANYLLCKLSGEAEKIGSLGLAEKLLDGYNILIKDLSSKKGFENGQFIRLAVRNCQDNDRLIFALKEIFS
ncbi:MAG: aminotransferase, partial [Spirochaetia bacterium]|nr:aminotransferase [Spirochaetia bacterium]